MAYKDNVQKMCDRLGLANPIREDDILIARLGFYVGGYHEYVYIQATDMNRGGRLFIQDAFCGPGYFATHVLYDDVFKKRAAEHFAELWQDVGQGKRALLDALNAGTAVVIFRKGMRLDSPEIVI